MKKTIVVIIKAIVFFVVWMLCVGFVPQPESLSPEIWRLFAELIPLITIVISTILFWFVEKKKIQLCLVNRPVYGTCIGITVGIIWLSASVGILILLGVLKISGSNHVPFIGIWILSVFINATMQELLIRGYLYQMIKKNYNTVIAAIVTTAIFTVLHGGAFEAGIIPVLNVITMSIFMTAILEYTRSLVAPIIIHFFWNGFGAIILGGVSLQDDYPHLLNSVFSGNTLLSGGDFKIEGSIVVLILNLVLMTFFIVKTINRNRLDSAI